MTPYVSELHQRSQRFHAEIARRALMVSPPEVRIGYFIPNTPFGTPKIRPVAPRIAQINLMALFYHTMWFWDVVNCPPPSKAKRVLSILDIQRATANHFGVSLAEMLSERRTHPLARIRQVAMYLSKTMTLRSLPDIGRRFGGRDHTTVIHAIKRVGQLIAENEQFAANVAEIKAKLSA